MPTYAYKAKNLKGETLEGNFDADSKDALVFMLHEKGYFLLEARQLGNDISFKGLVAKVTIKDLALFCRQFAVMINSGITIVESIGILREQVEKKKMRDTLESIHDDMQKGRLLSEAMELFPEVFPDFMLSMVKVGEASGSLDNILNRLADYYENDAKIRRKVRTALTYPSIIGVLTVGVVILLMVKILPMFSGILESTGGDMPMLTKVLMAISDFTVQNFPVIMFALLFIVAGFSYWKKTSAGRYWFDGIKLTLPLVRKSVTKIITARFARSLGILLKSGIPVIRAIDIIADLIGNKVVEENFHAAVDEIREGRGISGPLKKLKIFPPLLIHMVAIGESTGELDEMLSRTAGFFDEEVEETIDKLTAMIEPAMIIIMAAVVGTIILSIMLPMVNILTAVQ